MENLLLRFVNKKDFSDFQEFFSRIRLSNKKFFLRQDLLKELDKFAKDFSKPSTFLVKSSLVKFVRKIQELFKNSGFLVIFYRENIANHIFLELNSQEQCLEEIRHYQYLESKDQYIKKNPDKEKTLEIDFSSFYEYFPSIRDRKNVGQGMRFLNRHMSSSFFQDPAKWNEKLLGFLKIHKINQHTLLVNSSIIETIAFFEEQLEKVLSFLKEQKEDVPYSFLKNKMKKLGFEAGWGNSSTRIIETLEILKSLLNEPSSAALEEFLSRIPMVSKIAIISPHGWFGQKNVLGKPDTGGQVIYILDQVKALEKYLTEQFELSGIVITPKIIILTRLIPQAENTTCNQRLEKVSHTNNCWILRIPFYDKHHNIVPDWISRFHIWPYLDQFARNAKKELFYEFQSRPDLIIGNYSDGNIVGSLLSDAFGVTLCTIAHALEKAKYLFSDLYWENMEGKYHFSLQFSADLLSMNKSDFIIASTFQEIAGTDESMGQYESYQCFTLPGYYQVLSGINLLHPKFNIIPPGVDEENYFPYFETEKRVSSKTDFWKKRIFYDESKDVFGTLDDPDKPPLFTMARLDKIKNISGLLEAYGQNKELQKFANLIFAAGTILEKQSKDIEENWYE